MVKICAVESGSFAENVGIQKDDVLISVNGNDIRDVLDYRFYLAEKKVKLVLLRDGKKFKVKIKKGEYDDIGLGFETPLMDKKHSCKNGCIFCFIDQNPEGLRETLYFKDDDSRLSFIHGNYITLTNMNDEDIDRIIKMRISPINISIHTTNPALRVRMMKNKRSGEVLSYLSRFKKAGLSMCGQIVLCRGVNDGEELLRSMRDLSGYFPELSSVSVVPAGLTKHREGLYPLSDFTPEEAANIIDMIDKFAEEHKSRFGSRLFFAADEFYLKSGRSIPGADYYEGYPQIENGVGMIRSFTEEFLFAEDELSELSSSLSNGRSVTVVTGVASYEFIKKLTDRVQKICPKLKINTVMVKNRFFGESITVSGLLVGEDIFDALHGMELGDEVLIPKNCLRLPEEDFLSGMTRAELESKLNVPVIPVGEDGYELALSLFGKRG